MSAISCALSCPPTPLGGAAGGAAVEASAEEQGRGGGVVGRPAAVPHRRAAPSSVAAAAHAVRRTAVTGAAEAYADAVAVHAARAADVDAELLQRRRVERG